MLSYNLKRQALIRGLRYASTENPNGFTPILEQIEKYYGYNKTINDKLQSLKLIMPQSNDGFEKKTITMGIIHENGVSEGLLTNSLISDPFSSIPPTPLINEFRKSHHGKNIKIIPANFQINDANEYLGGGIFKLKSPFLSSDNRVLYDIKQGDGSSQYLQTLKERGVFNDISIVEVNDLDFTPIDDVKGVEEISLSTSTESHSEINFSDPQMWIYVTNDSTNVDLLNDLPYTVVINSSENSNMIGSIKDNVKSMDSKVDLNKIEQANDLLGMDVKNVNEFIRLHKESNINELLHGLIVSTSGYNIQTHLLKSLIRDIVSTERGYDSNKRRLIDLEDKEIKKELELSVKNWSQGAHYDLQSIVDPYLNEVLLRKYSGIFQLVINSGDLSVVLSNILLETRDDINVKKGLIFGKSIEGHGSLKDQWSNGKYLEGKIDGIVPLNKMSSIENDSIDSIERSINKTLSGNILPQLQSKLNDILIQNLTIPPLVTSIVSSIGFIEDMITLNTGCSLTLFAIALGAFRAQSGIGHAMSEAKRQWMDELRKGIEKSNKYLWGKIGINVSEKSGIDAEREKALNNLRKRLEELEKLQLEFMKK